MHEGKINDSQSGEFRNDIMDDENTIELRDST